MNFRGRMTIHSEELHLGVLISNPIPESAWPTQLWTYQRLIINDKVRQACKWELKHTCITLIIINQSVLYHVT